MVDSNPLLTIDEANADEAYELVLPEAMAMAREATVPINVDVMGAVFTTMGVARKLPGFEAELKTLTQFPSAILAKFPQYILATYSAQTRYTFATTPPEQLPELMEKGTKWREVLGAEARSLVARGFLNGELLKELTGTHGFRNVAVDLAGYARIYKSAWADIQAHSGLKEADILEVEKLALKLTGAVAKKEQSPEQVAAATDVRARIFTLLVNAYDEIRRAMQFLRWHEGDADVIAPSLYAGRPNSNIRKANSDGNTNVNAVSATAPTVLPNVPVAVAQPAARVPVGLPGGDPLGH